MCTGYETCLTSPEILEGAKNAIFIHISVLWYTFGRPSTSFVDHKPLGDAVAVAALRFPP